MRLLLVTTYFEPDSGAAAVRLSRLARLLHARGHDVTALAALPHYPQGRIRDGYRGRFAIVENRDGLRAVRTWLWATSSSRISRKLVSQNTFMLTAALRGLAMKRPDVILIEAQPIFTSLAGVFLSRVKRAPYVLNVSDLWPDHLLSVGALSERHPVYRMARRLVNATYRGAAHIVAMSPAWASAIQGHVGDGQKISVIYNGVDLASFRPDRDTTAFRARYGLTDHFVISFIGTFATQYDFETLFGAVRRFEGREDVRFVFVGAGSQGDVVRQQLPGLTNVVWVDWLDHGEMPFAWAASDVTCWALRPEPLYQGTIPAKLYEALASGVPVVAAMQGEGAAMLARAGAGVAVPCGDVEGLTGALERLVEDATSRRQYSRSARAYAEAHFDPEDVASAYEAVLKGAARL